jgi:leucyl-tRNA synthetase
VYVADYVLGSYGTGAVMAVAAHDTRDMEFASKYGLSIKQSIVPEEITYSVIEKSLPIGAKEKIEKIGHLEVEKFIDEDWGHLWKVHVSQEKESDLLNFLSENIAKKKFYADSIGESNFVVYPKVFFNVLTRDDLERFKEIGRSVDIPEEQLDIEPKAFTKDGIVINSGEFSGLTSAEARKKMTAWLRGERSSAGKSVKYKMRDWTFSRQRYWGEPIPVVHCEEVRRGAGQGVGSSGAVAGGGVVRADGNGRIAACGYSGVGECAVPLSAGASGKRETNTMPQWAGSCVVLPPVHRSEERRSVRRGRNWKGNGCRSTSMWVARSTRRGISSMPRFWHKFLFDIGVVSTDEPFKRLVHVGLINASDGRKMSKRWGNVVNPDDIIRDFGADALRLYEMFMGPFTQNIAWNTEGLVGTRRFLDKIWKLSEKVTRNKERGTSGNEKLEAAVHRTIRKVTEDVDDFKFNTAISALMILANAMEKENHVSDIVYREFLILLSPFAPHIAEELWGKLGNERSIFLEKWPQYDSEKAVETQVTIAVSVNGKVRDIITVARDASEETLRSKAFSSEKVRKYLEGKEPKKVIVVPGRIVNIVI